MIGPQKMEWYRHAAPAEKFREFMELLEAVEEILSALPPAERERRMAFYWREREKSSQALLEGLARAR
jgi:hypothetical protein